MAFLTAPHPFFEDLPDDATAFAALLKEQGIENITVLTQHNLAQLVFDGKNLMLMNRDAPPTPIHIIDRFIDIYEIAE